MKTTLFLATVAMAVSNFAYSQALDGTSGLTMGNTGKISGLPLITSANSVTNTGYSWEFTTLLQGFAVPAAQLTGLSTTGAPVFYEDLIPLKTSKLSVMAGTPGAGPTGTGTVIDANGIETNALSLLDSASNTVAPLTIQNGVLRVGSSRLLNSSNLTISLTSGSAANGYCSAALTGGLAVGSFSTALSRATANGANSTAMSFGTANGWGSVATGYATANGAYSTAMSTGTTNGDFSTAMTGGTTNDYCSTAMTGGTTRGYYSTAMSGAGTNGIYATAMSYGYAANDYATAMSGGGANGRYSLASGQGAVANSFSSVSFGRFNDDAGGSPGSWVETDPVFLVGNGGYDVSGNWTGQPSNALSVLKNGKTTLTNKAWKADPAVGPTVANSQGEALVVEGHTRLKGKVIIEQPQGDISMGIYQ